MTKYHAVLLDECREEFGVSVEAKSRALAYAALEENYPESRVVQLESPYDSLQRERRYYRQAQRNYDRGY